MHFHLSLPLLVLLLLLFLGLSVESGAVRPLPSDTSSNDAAVHLSARDVLINILTRSGSRENAFKRLLASIESQTYHRRRKIRHIKSNDNPASCGYLCGMEDVVNVNLEVKHHGVNQSQNNLYPWNDYLNTLGAKVNDGWINVLDDDPNPNPIPDPNTNPYLNLGHRRLDHRAR